MREGWRGSRSLLPGGTKSQRGSPLRNERRQTGKRRGLGELVIEVGEEVDAQFLGSGNQGLKGIPRFNPFMGSSLQAHIPFAYSLPGSSFCRVIVQQDFGMGKHHE